MTPQEIAHQLVEEFARKAEDFIWGCDHIHYKGADELLKRMVAEVVAAERERCARLCVRRSCSWSVEDDARSNDFREGVEVAASQLAAAIRGLNEK